MEDLTEEEHLEFQTCWLILELRDLREDAQKKYDNSLNTFWLGVVRGYTSAIDNIYKTYHWVQNLPPRDAR